MADTRRCWLVERSFDDRNLVTIVYATPDGRRLQRRERSSVALRTGSPVTAATEVDVDDLEPVDDPDRRERYATEAERMRTAHAPDDPV